MKRFYPFLFLSLLWMISCNSPDEDNSSGEADGDNDLNVAIGFVQAALKGKYDLAGNYMLHDSVNDQRLEAVSRMRLTPDERQGLWDATVKIHSRKLVNDSTSIIIYSNSFHADNKDTLKIVRKDGKWLVDFKYLFDHDQTYPPIDSLENSAPR